MSEQFGEDRSDLATVAHDVATLSADFAEMARTYGLDMLGYLLNMARLEAENVTCRSGAGAE
jgi:hypothetical protein